MGSLPFTHPRSFPLLKKKGAGITSEEHQQSQPTDVIYLASQAVESDKSIKLLRNVSDDSLDQTTLQNVGMSQERNGKSRQDLIR